MPEIRAREEHKENMRYLSKLQKTILALALDKNGAILVTADVKAKYYGFPLRQRGKLWFHVPEIGLRKYRVAGACVSRAVATLERKKLVLRFYNGLTLTDTGKAVAGQIKKAN